MIHAVVVEDQNKNEELQKIIDSLNKRIEELEEENDNMKETIKCFT